MLDQDYKNFIAEKLAIFDGIYGKAMFGGYSFYRDGKIFAIIAEDKLYFKVGDSNQADYEQAGMGPFTYTGHNGKPYEMSYWELPEEILNDPPELSKWAEKSFAVAAKTNKKRSG